MSNLKRLQSRAEAAAERFEEGRSRLYRKDGKPKYSEAETSERLASLKAERDVVLVPVAGEANKLMWQASEKLKRVRNADPATLLTDGELSAANA